MLDLLIDDAQRIWTGVLAVVSLLSRRRWSRLQPVAGRVVALGGMFEIDRMAQVLKVVTLLVVAVVFVYSTDYLQRRSILKGEYYVLGLFATLGIMVLVSAGEPDHPVSRASSCCRCACTPWWPSTASPAWRPSRPSSISCWARMASGTLLYGMSIIYGMTGSLQLAAIAAAVQGGLGGNVGLIFGIAFLIVGIAFKLGAVPFHMWIPDVYEGSPTCVTLFIGTASKLAAFALAHAAAAEALGGSQARLEPDARGARGAVDGDRQHRGDRADATSSACWRIRRSRTSASSCWASWPARRRATRRRCST